MTPVSESEVAPLQSGGIIVNAPNIWFFNLSAHHFWTIECVVPSSDNKVVVFFTANRLVHKQ